MGAAVLADDVFDAALPDQIVGDGAAVGADVGQDCVEAGYVEGFGAVPVLGAVGEGGDLAVGEVEVVGVDDC